MKIFVDLWWYFKQEKWKYLSGIVFLIASSFLTMIPPYVVGVIVDAIRTHTLTAARLWEWIGLLVIMGIVYYATGYLWRQMIYGSSVRLSKLLRNRLYDLFTWLSPNFYHKRRIGDLMAHATNDIRAVENAAGDGILTLIDSLTMGAMVIIAMAGMINWKLTIIALIPMPFMAWATSRYGAMLHKRFHVAQAAFSDLNDKVQENVSGVRVIKAFGQEEAEKKTFRDLSADVVKKNIAVAKIDALFDPTITFIVGLSYFLAIAFGAIFVVQGTMTIGQLTSFTLYLGQLVWPMLAFGFLFNIVERGRASHDRIMSLLSEIPDIVDHEHAIDQVPSGQLTYNLSAFHYADDAPAALEGIHFSLAQGETVGVVGKTGSGKTTLFKLLLREFDCEEEGILIGEKPITAYKIHKLRQAIGYVPQDHFLFSATIAENIAFARPDATREEIEEAAKRACIHDDILGFENGYETVVGERGVTLSGGQKQRISIARALIMEPEIMVLDDSLSAVDADTEEAILTALRETRRNKTTLISAHRLSAVKHADLIIVLDEGKIAERGTHEDLMARNGWYASMYRRQQLESLVAEGGEPV
ncbi:ABC transporter transmembrane domain-containing protein [Camelliibacillus cellulosilyticus]|uniref:ABC transporter transmembrane domain-containing protein n=1 Tax=Camelliibacillus cellulosilyticus TaxID=2174486 RepID=A0ABV9GFN8_9BACL